MKNNLQTNVNIYNVNASLFDEKIKAEETINAKKYPKKKTIPIIRLKDCLNSKWIK